MPKIEYVPKKFTTAHQQIIDQANDIFDEYRAGGYVLTLRQLYYQFVSRDLIENSLQSYKRLGSIINDARLAGLIDWNMMEDRTRNLQEQPSWRSPHSIVSACASQFRIDKWENQPHRIEVWIEKDALAGVFERICNRLQVPYFSCRGYTSQSEMWEASQRFITNEANDQSTIILHFGDHDPSGIDMTRDIMDRLKLFMGGITLERLALNMDQVNQYGPPPNPAKVTDSRAGTYIANYGHESWELDALEPAVLTQLVDENVRGFRDQDLWNQAVEEENEHKRLLQVVADDWNTITEEL